MARSAKSQGATEKEAQLEQVPLFFEQGEHPTLRHWVAVVTAVGVILSVVWVLEERSAAPLAAPAGASVAYDLSGAPLGGTSDPGEGPRVGRPAPDFALTDLQGTVWRLSTLRGKTLVVNFWATWCPPCRAEMPELDALSQKFRNEEVVVLGVNLREGFPQVSRFAQILNITFPILLDPQGQAIARYNIVALPTTFFIDRDGVVTDINIGALSDRALEAKLQKARR